MFYHLRKKLRKTLWGVAKCFPPKVKSFQNTATYQKLLGGVPVKTPLPHPLPHLIPQWGYEYGSGIAFPVPKTKHVAFMYLTELK